MTTARSGGESCGDTFIPASGKQVLGLALCFRQTSEGFEVDFKFCAEQPKRLNVRCHSPLFPMSALEFRRRKIEIVLLAIIFAIGIFLRITPQAFEPGASLHFCTAFHPQPSYMKLGFDEELYRKYVNGVIAEG